MFTWLINLFNLSNLHYGYFGKMPQIEFLEDGRRVRLLQDFTYTDKSGKVWLAEKGHIVDGASIPQIFWSITEGPLDGKFRNASIIHDVACDQKKEPWQAVHLMFYEACRCGGVNESKAKLMYGAVYFFGPRWGQMISMGAPVDIDRLERLILEKNPTLEEIRNAS